MIREHQNRSCCNLRHQRKRELKFYMYMYIGVDVDVLFLHRTHIFPMKTFDYILLLLIFLAKKIFVSVYNLRCYDENKTAETFLIKLNEDKTAFSIFHLLFDILFFNLSGGKILRAIGQKVI